ncbi:MAG TPA: Hsp20 family protein [Bacilli bacterium]|nr:Hsp20 family protein [Bacilli bacterium]
MRYITKRNWLDDVFDSIFDSFIFGTDPRVDIYEDEKGVTFEIEVPGFKKEDISVELRDHILTVNAVKKEESEQKNDSYHYYLKGRKDIEIRRSYRLKSDVTEDDIKVKLEDGVLKINILKNNREIPAPKQILIE